MDQDRFGIYKKGGGGGGGGVIAYSRPQNDFLISYNTFDEGYQYINTTDTYVVPLNALINQIDRDDWYKIILDERSKGHLYRFLGLNDGYYNSDDDTYRLSDGTLSDRATVFDDDDYLVDRFTGLGWRTRRGGASGLVSAMADAESASWNSFTDWHIPTYAQHKSIILKYLPSQVTYATQSKVFDIQLPKWTCTPYAPSPTLSGFSINTIGVDVANRLYGNSDARSYVRYALN